MNRVILVIGAIVLVLLAVVALGGFGMLEMVRLGFVGPGILGYGGMHGMMRGFGGVGFGFGPLGAIIQLVSWALVIGGLVLVVVWLGRSAVGNAAAPDSFPTPLDVLKERYARGEITKDQFETIRHDLA